MSLLFRTLITLALLGMCLAASVFQRRSVSGADQTVIVDKHNELRRKVSPTATNMRKMHWDPDLARAAQIWVDQCTAGHDSNYARRQNANIGAPVGQNFAQDWSWAEAIQAWYDEVKYFDFGTQDTNTAGEAVGHYTQVVWSESSLVGCAMATCPGDVYHYICNYAYGNLNGQNVYEDGASCAACGTDKCDDKLCDCPAGKICKNGGSLNLRDCSCTCANGFTGDSCELCPFEDVHKSCGTTYPPSYCAIYANIPANCPVMCGFCPDTCPGKDINSCQNGGSLNNDCTCMCTPGYSGDLCQTVSNCVDESYCGKDWPQGFPLSFCTMYSNVPAACPRMCGKC